MTRTLDSRTPEQQVAAVVSMADGAYSQNRYTPGAWRQIARFLLEHGHTDREAAAIMLSKHMRWCGDNSSFHRDDNRVSSVDFARYYGENEAPAQIHHDHTATTWQAEGRRLADDIFGPYCEVSDDYADLSTAGGTGRDKR